jgi:hypothetical protein
LEVLPVWIGEPVVTLYAKTHVENRIVTETITELTEKQEG